MRVAGRGEQRPGPGAWRSGGGLGPVGFPQVGASGGGGGLRGGGEVMAQGQPGPGELLRPLLWPTPRGEARHVSRHSQGTWACPVRPLPSGLAMAPGSALPCPQPALTREARPPVTPWGASHRSLRLAFLSLPLPHPFPGVAAPPAALTSVCMAAQRALDSPATLLGLSLCWETSCNASQEVSARKAGRICCTWREAVCQVWGALGLEGAKCGTEPGCAPGCCSDRQSGKACSWKSK